MSNIYENIERQRKPRVHIKYEVETENGTLEKELPFVVGVLGDYTGNAPREFVPVKERQFITIDKDNFEQVMQQLGPGLSLTVKNTLSTNEELLNVALSFNSLNDFSPERVVEQVPVLKRLLDLRNALRDLQVQTDKSDELTQLLEEALQSKDKLADLAQLLLPENPS